MIYDVLVVGAGPSGSTLSKLLSEKGLKVILIDKEKFPRFKPCAGCISKRAEKLLPHDFRNVVLNDINSGYLGWKGEILSRETKMGSPCAFIVSREIFDNYLLEKAKEKGTQFSDGNPILNIDIFEKKGIISASTKIGEIKARYLVGADGVNSRVKKILKIRLPVHYPAYEIFAKFDKPIGSNSALIEIGILKHGYFWLFPHGNGICSGIVGRANNNYELKKIFNKIFKKRIQTDINIYKEKGWIVPYKPTVYNYKNKIFFVGDAAGFCDALLSEGIYWGILSAYSLSEALIKEEPQIYKELLSPIKTELFSTFVTAKIFYNLQKISFKLSNTTSIIEKFMMTLSGEMTNTVFLKWLLKQGAKHLLTGKFIKIFY